MKNPLKSRRGKIAAIVGALVGIAGVALAAFLISGAVSGSLSFRDSNADFQVSSISGTNTANGMDCSNVAADGRDVTLNPVLTRFTAPGQTEVPAQSCRISLTVSNTGSAPIAFAGWKLAPDLPGLTSRFSYGTDGSTIPAGGRANYALELTVARNGGTPAERLQGYLQFTSAGAGGGSY